MYTCLSGDTKTTTGITTNSVLVETNTGTIYTFTSGAWNSVGGGGAGEANLAANVGTGTGTIFRDKTSVTLNLKTIKAGTGVTITNNTNDITLDATGAGGGETNTYSTVGTGAAWTLTKSGVNLPFRSIIMGSSKLALTTNTNDLTIDVAQANLSIAYSQLTSVPSTFAPTAHKSAHASGGGDAFVKADVLVAASRYIETRTDPASDAQAIWINATSSDMEYWDTQAAPVKQTIATIGSTQTFTGKTMSGASNTFSNIAYSSLTSVPTTIVKTDQTNTFGAFAQIFPSTQLKLLSNGFNYIFTGTTIAADRTVNLPLMTGTDTLAVLDLAQAFTTKTIVAASNTITDTSATTGDILRHNGTRFVRKGVGTGLQVLRTNSGATDIEWASLISETTGTALASGNGSTTVFNVAHGLGSNPTCAIIACSTFTNPFTYTTDSTNIIVTFTTAPTSGR